MSTDEVNMSPDIINSLKHGREHPFIVQSAEEDLLNREPNEEVIVALNNLPANFRTVLIAVDVMGMSYKEAAEYLDIPIGTVMSRLNRARTAVQKSLVKANSPLIKEYKKKDK